MKSQLMQLRLRWGRVPARTRMGLLIAVVAMAGLAWQHHTSAEPASQPAAPSAPAAVAATDHSHDVADDAAVGEYQPDPSDVAPRLDLSPEAARATVERFATNFASPNGDRDDWLARITPDVVPDLLDQYRTTDIRNLPEASVQAITGPLPGDAATPSFHVVYSEGTNIEVRLEMSGDGWVVATVLPLAPSIPAPGLAPPAPEGARMPPMQVASLTGETAE